MCVKRLYCDCAIVMNVYAVEGLCKMPSLLLFYGRGKSSRLGREESMDACITRPWLLLLRELAELGVDKMFPLEDVIGAVSSHLSALRR